MEKLRISNFAGLKSVEVEIRPVTGFIGPEASGKSIIAKLLYFFRQITSRLPTAIRYEHAAAQYRSECRDRFSRYFPFEDASQSDFQIAYLNNDEAIRVTYSSKGGVSARGLRLEWSRFYEEVLKRFTRRKKDVPALGDDPGKFAVGTVLLNEGIEKEIRNILGSSASFAQIFIPAGRAFFSQVQSTVFTQLAEGQSLDPFMAEFGAFLEQSRSVLESSGFFESPDFAGLRSTFEKLLHAQFLTVRKQDFLEFDDGRRVKLAQASSGQQEALPMLLLLARFVSLGLGRGRSVYIEEPEAHLFPSTQKLLVEFVAQTFRRRSGKMNLVVTTHSPYILTSMNNLLQAGKLYAESSPKVKQRLAKIISRTSVFAPREVAFYALENGKAKSLVDAETGLIHADVIDRVSDDIAIQFNKLLPEENENS
jgi:hypothetical protein